MKSQNPKEFIGKKVKTIQNGAGIPAGITAKVTDGFKKGEDDVEQSGVYIEGYPGNLLYMTEFKIDSLTKEEIRKKITSLEEEISELKSKEQFIIDNNLEEFEENQYTVFKTLEILDKENISNFEKSKLIADLINK